MPDTTIACTKKEASAIISSMRYSYTQVRVLIGLAAGGGVSALVDMFQGGNVDVFTHAGLVGFCKAFVRGAIVAVLFHFVPVPIKPGTRDAKAFEAPCEDSK